jgi:hypothetical protein
MQRSELGNPTSAADYIVDRREMETLSYGDVLPLTYVHLLIIPMVRSLAFKLGAEPSAFLRDTTPLEAPWLPTIFSVWPQRDRLPIGLQITGAPDRDAAALCFQDETDFHLRRPAIWATMRLRWRLRNLRLP